MPIKEQLLHNIINLFYFSEAALVCMQVMNLIGDVKGKVAVMVDDMIDTAGELGLIFIGKCQLINFFCLGGNCDVWERKEFGEMNNIVYLGVSGSFI